MIGMTLTPRERRLAVAYAGGELIGDIAEREQMSTEGVRHILRRARRKLGVSNDSRVWLRRSLEDLERCPDLQGAGF